MRTFKITLAYDGTNYAGWQRQHTDPTIQGLVEDAISEVEGQSVKLYAAGRTDAGVHALGQVASVCLSHSIDSMALLRAVNSKLPRDVRVVDVQQVADTFHARFDTSEKYYRYRLGIGRVQNPLERRFLWWLSESIKLSPMREASNALCGQHDFASFQTATDDSSPKSTVRTITAINIGVEEAQSWSALGGNREARIITVDIHGNGFLRHMVRTIVGTLVEIGRDRRAPESMMTLLSSRDRRQAGPTAPARGLFLVSVEYP